MVFLKRWLPTAVTMAVGIVTLLLYVLPALQEGAESLALIRGYWIELAVVIAGFALVLGILNLLAVHWGRIIRRQPGWLYSFVAIAAAILVLFVSFAEMITGQGITGPGTTAIYKFGLHPLQSSFAALLAFLLAFAAYRALRLRQGISAWFFVLAALVVLVAQAVPGMRGIRDWLVNVWATAGLRGVLLGIGLGTAATMMRILLGFDRPASE